MKTISSSRRHRPPHRSWCPRQHRHRHRLLCLRRSNSSARLLLPKVEAVPAKAIAVGVTTTSLAVISQQQPYQTLIPARCSQIRAGRALWKNSSKNWKLRLLASRKWRLIAAVFRLGLTEFIWKCDRESVKKPNSRSHYFIPKNL